MYMIKNLLNRFYRKDKYFVGKLLQTEKEGIDFAKNHSLYMN